MGGRNKHGMTGRKKVDYQQTRLQGLIFIWMTVPGDLAVDGRWRHCGLKGSWLTPSPDRADWKLSVDTVDLNTLLNTEPVI